MTYNQLLRSPRKPVVKTVGEPLMDGRPQRKVECLSVLVKNPKKPNSANRSVALVAFRNGKKSIAMIPGEGHDVQQYNTLLVRGGRTKDLPGVKVKVIRGKKDSSGVKGRLSSRSKYGVSNPKKRVDGSILYLRARNRADQKSKGA